MRSRRLPLVSAPFIVLLLLGSLYIRRDRLSWFPPSHSRPVPYKQLSKEVVGNGAILPATNISEYLEAIYNVKPMASLPHLECPAINTTRYHIIEVIRFLGPRSCALSIVEGDSPDGTGDVLAALRPSLEAMGVTYIYNSSTVHSGEGNRIAKLAKLRNMPLEPLFRQTIPVAEDASVIFLNDVAACPEDILELLLQKRALNADMTCAMDWTYSGNEPTFYDVWIARGINGDSFFHIPPSGSWGEALNLFWNAPETKSRFDRLRPFQVFACWNGATVFSAQPVLEGLHFRTNYDKTGECFQGEPVLFCKDMWFRGYGKIAVVPSVNLEYSTRNGRRIKELKGFTSDIVANQDPRGDLIEWAGPPDTVRCMPTWKDQFFQRWNKSLTE
ncbi:glycosyltransferase family 69 [Trichoderma cornu-damae]|uniref:Glycosyltransferase family 69 n=1 Tax=Trichoderma cornu-damae TaxID=654480 RepID=A0A9P8TTE8_9HYPO|nr:glycosyltransferase family 69 [Trichoderma cornu-damae]